MNTGKSFVFCKVCGMPAYDLCGDYTIKNGKAVHFTCLKNDIQFELEEGNFDTEFYLEDKLN